MRASFSAVGRLCLTGAGLVSLLAGCALSSPGVSKTSPETEDGYPRLIDLVPTEPNFRVFDRGLQPGLSKAAGWPKADFQVAEPFLESWPTSFSRKELIDTAMARTQDYVEAASNLGGTRSLEIHFEDGFPNQHKDWIRELAEESMAVFGDDIYPEGVHLIVGDSGHVVEVLEEIGKSAEFVDQYCGNDGAEPGDIFFCARSDVGTVRFGRTIDLGVLEESGGWTAVVGHEMFHLFQGYQWDKHNDESGEPNWMSEGTAEFFGFAIADLADVSSYYVSPWEWFYYLPNPGLGLEQFASIPPFPHPPEPYWMGQMATEYLVASLGFEALLDIYREFGSTGDFDAAFQEATGLTMDEFYQVFDEAYRNLFSQNSELAVYQDRKCPTWWGDCTLAWGDEGFLEKLENREVGESNSEGDSDVGESNSEGDSDVGESNSERDSDWWKDVDVAVALPREAENSDHGLSVDRGVMLSNLTCTEINNYLEWENGIAASFAFRSSSDVQVSTQWYVGYQHLDFNQDGVVCDDEDR